jgi:signal transduction histidine kinase/ActR/RegA family two-component response regulator/putative methionine-R-sulfoxide reductase with GAF domain
MEESAQSSALLVDDGLEVRTRERDEVQRRLEAFERIASAALETEDLDEFLNSLLWVFLGAADAAETVSILLRRGDTLFVRASHGIPDAADFSIRVGEGFAGRIAASGHAELLVGDAIASVVRGPLLRKRGLRALYGVPLAHEGQIVGVAHIGSTKADSFTETEMRVLRAVIDRAAWAVSRSHARQKLSTIVDASPAAIGIFRAPDYRCEFANDACRKWFGGRDVVGVRGSELGATTALLSLFERVMVGGAVVALPEVSLATHWATGEDAAERFFQVGLHPLRDAIGRPESVLLVAIDLTPQVLTRQALERSEQERGRLLELERAARREAEVASRMKDEFLATVSHELRTPLNSILGWVTSARRGVTRDIDRALATIERAARAQARIVEDVLDLSRIVTGKLRLDVNSVQIADVLAGALDAVRPAADAKGVDLHVQADDELGMVAADADRLQQIIWNLLSNAVKFTPSGGRVQLAATREVSKIVLRVADTGPGIEPDFLPFIFEPFRQGDGSTTRRHGGLGLGLAIVKQLVLAHGGTIRAESDGPGKGATFIVELSARTTPVAARVGPRSSQDPEEIPAGMPLGRVDGLRVLVVDDDSDFRELIRELLEHHGADVEVAGSVDEALQRVARFRPSVIISDIGMPHADGYALIRQLRARPPESGGTTPVIALTAYARPQDRRQTAAAGFDEHLSKPVDLPELVAQVAKWGNRATRS